MEALARLQSQCDSSLGEPTEAFRGATRQLEIDHGAPATIVGAEDPPPRTGTGSHGAPEAQSHPEESQLFLVNGL